MNTPIAISNSTILLSILGSSVMAAFLTKLADYIFNNVNYKRDYYKKIIDKRIEAYEELMKCLSQSDSFSVDKSDDGVYPGIFETGKTAISYQQKIVSLNNNRMWITERTNLIIDEITILIAEYLEKHNIFLNSTALECMPFAKEIEAPIRVKTHQAYILIFEDLKNLHDVKDFFKNRMDIGQDPTQYKTTLIE